MQTFGPDDFFLVRKTFEAHLGSVAVDQILALLRFTGWDFLCLRGCYAALVHCLPETPEPWRQEVRRAIAAVWDTYYHIGESWDLPFHLGTLQLTMNCPSDALKYFQYSLELYGPSAKTLHNLALCHEHLGDSPAALSFREQAEKVAPAGKLP